LLYENISDSAASSLTLAEAIAQFLIACAALIGVAAGAVGAALIILLEALFGIVYEIASFITADVWDSSFTNQLECLLVACATNDAGVVTFDWDCFWHSLADQTNAFDLTSDQLRLYAQIMYILQILGGAAALNTMGALTAITEADCSDCPWCVVFDFRTGDCGFIPTYSDGGGVLTGAGWEASFTREGSGITVQATDCAVVRDLTGITLTHVTLQFRDAVGGNFTGAPGGAYATYAEVNTSLIHGVSSPSGDFVIDFDYAGDAGVLGCFSRMGYTVSDGAPGGSVTLESITLHGTGDKPTLGEDC